MLPSDFPFGFRILGSPYEDRRLVDHAAAFAAYAACDQRAECAREAYLSAFRFGEDFREHLESTGSTAGFSGPCWSPWLWFDIDAEGDLARGQADAEALAEVLATHYVVEPADLLLFFSGSKGFHLGLPTALWSPAPSLAFHRTARRFAEHVAELAAVTIDTGVYDRVRAFRAPNSRHPKTGLHKRRLTLDELRGPLDAVLELAKTPAPFTVPTVAKASDTSAADWQAAADQVAKEGEAKAARRAAGNGAPTLNRATLDFIRDGAHQGDRHRLLFSAAANLAEFGCTSALAFALLEESSLDSGLPPKDVRRQIECGLSAAGSTPTRQDAPESTQAGSVDPKVENPPERNTGYSTGPEGQTCQQVTGATDSAPAPDLKAALALLWAPPPIGAAGTPPTDAPPAPLPTMEKAKALAALPPDPPALSPLLPQAVGTGRLETPCKKCGSLDYVDVAISEGRTRRDCRKCGRFAGWGRWYDEGGATR